jgi:4-amino-4-deoxy-L-arabinose transferase-like glycosyltransferase
MAVAALTLAIMVLTEPSLTIVWDEGYSLGREARVRTWFRALWDPVAFAEAWQPPVEDLVPPNRFSPPRRDQLATRAGLLSPPVLDWFWPFAREEPDGHPPVYALVGLLGDLVAPTWETLPRARLGPMLVFSLTCGALFCFFKARWGPWSAFAAAGAWMFQPHLFALAHYATYDGLLTSLWTGSVLAFAKAVERGAGSPTILPHGRWVVVFGLLAACAMGTKLTGWLLPLPFLAWAILYRDRRGMVALVTGVLLAVAVLIALTPPWWRNPVFGLDRFFQSNLTRATTTPLKTLFLGTIYETPNGSLPWYNTAVWTLVVTPVGFLLLASAGIVQVAFRDPGRARLLPSLTGMRLGRSLVLPELRKPIQVLSRASSESLGMLFLVHWAFLMVLRALPHTPGHDGIRQFLPAFGLLALLAGLGAASVRNRIGAWGKSVILLAVVEGAVSVGLLMPVPLSYYSPLIGGLPGAARLGMEPTYYWDALQPEILEWLNAHTAPDQKVMFSRYPTSLLYLRQTHRLRVGIQPHEPGEWAWYVVQNRSGALWAMERDLIAHGHPAKVFRKCGVHLLWVFPYSEVEAWQRGELRPVNRPRSVSTGDSVGSIVAGSFRVRPLVLRAGSLIKASQALLGLGVKRVSGYGELVPGSGLLEPVQ